MGNENGLKLPAIKIKADHLSELDEIIVFKWVRKCDHCGNLTPFASYYFDVHGIYHIGSIKRLDEYLEENYPFVKKYGHDEYFIECIHCKNPHSAGHFILTQRMRELMEMEGEDIEKIIDARLPNDLKINELVKNANFFQDFFKDLISSLKNNGYQIKGYDPHTSDYLFFKKNSKEYQIEMFTVEGRQTGEDDQIAYLFKEEIEIIVQVLKDLEVEILKACYVVPIDDLTEHEKANIHDKSIYNIILKHQNTVYSLELSHVDISEFRRVK